MTTFADFFLSVKDEITARYRSPIWGSALIVLTAFHWKVIVFFLTEKPSANEAIAFVEANVSFESITNAIVVTLGYVIFFPWVELVTAYATSFGRRARNRFHMEEREREIGQRKLIASRQAQLIEIEIKNNTDHSMLVDIALARDYQQILSGENFVRWMNDARKGSINHSLQSSIYSYLQKIDTVEGKFINSEIEASHAKFVSHLSTLGTELSNLSGAINSKQLVELERHIAPTLESHQAYRNLVRRILKV